MLIERPKGKRWDFRGRVLTGGEHLVPESALAALAEQGISFTVKGVASYEQQVGRFEVLLPRQFNDAGVVPEERLAGAVLFSGFRNFGATCDTDGLGVDVA